MQQRDVINQAALIATTEPPPIRPVAVTIRKFNLEWVLEVAPAAGWVPGWRDPCIAAVLVGSAVLSVMLLWSQVVQEKHNMLLLAMLPEKVRHGRVYDPSLDVRGHVMYDLPCAI